MDGEEKAGVEKQMILPLICADKHRLELAANQREETRISPELIRVVTE